MMANRTPEEQACASKMSARAIKVRPEPYAQSKIEDAYYMEHCDAYIHKALLALEEPKVSDFEHLFNAFEKSFLHGPTSDPIYKAALDGIAPWHTRMCMCMQRYTGK